MIGRSMVLVKHRLFKRIVPWLQPRPDMYSHNYVVKELLGSKHSIFLLIGASGFSGNGRKRKRKRTKTKKEMVVKKVTNVV